jgi:hypothetical protein
VGRALGWALALLAWTAGAQDLASRVVAVADGDTLTVLAAGNRPVKVRLAGIDAPERDQPFGQRSRLSLAELAFGRTATVTVQKTDDYGRAVGTVTVGGANVEVEQVRRGLAWVSTATTATMPGCGRWKWRRERRGAGCGPTPSRFRRGTGGTTKRQWHDRNRRRPSLILRGAAGPSGPAARWPRVKRRGFISRNVG